MSDDDVLRDRLRAAADAASAGADPNTALRRIKEGPPVTPAPRPRLWLLGGFAAVALVGGTLAGATALRAEDAGTAASEGTAAAVDTRVGSTFDCPDGNRVGDLRAGDRVFVVGRDESGSWAAIRDPRHTATIVWVPDVSLQRDASTEVDVIDCHEPVLLVVPGTPSETTTTTTPASTTTVAGSTPTTSRAPTTTAAPKPGVTTTIPSTTSVTSTTTTAPDTQQPTVASPSASPNEIYRSTYPECDTSSALSAVAADNVGVASVTGTYTGLPGSPIAFTRTAGTATNGTWTATFGPFNSSTFMLDVVITITVRDAAGNARATNVTVRYWNECLG